MTNQEIIKKYSFKITTKNGIEGLQLQKAPTAADRNYIIANKLDIISEIKKAEADIEAEIINGRNATIEEQKDIKVLALIDSGSYLIDCAIVYVIPFSEEEKEGYREWAIEKGLFNYAEDNEKIEISKFNKLNLVKAIRERKVDGTLGHGESNIRFITELEKKNILAEIKALEEKKETETKIATEKRAEKINVIFEKAKTTGKKQEIERFTEECNDPDEECNVDICVKYALPNGKIDVTRNHTW